MKYIVELTKVTCFISASSRFKQTFKQAKLHLPYYLKYESVYPKVNVLRWVPSSNDRLPSKALSRKYVTFCDSAALCNPNGLLVFAT